MIKLMVHKTSKFGLKRSPLILTAVVTAVLGIVSLPLTSAVASTFPGSNGKMYYVDAASGDIGTVKLDGSGAQTVLTSSSSSVSLSPDGTKIAFDSWNGSGFDLHIANFDGSNNVTLPNSSGNDYHPSWSPDGQKLAYLCQAGSQQICTTNINGTSRTQLTHEALDNDRPSWSPDGTKIVYQKTGGGNGVDIYVMNADGSNKTPLANSSAHEQEPSWSPDGSKILYSRFTDNTYLYEIYQMNSDGSGQTRITNHTEQDGMPMYSPDASKIYFLSESDGFGAYRLYSMNVDGTNLTKISNTISVSSFEVQPLTLSPTTNNSHPTISVSGGTASIDIPAMYSDPYGVGVATSSVAVTSTPAYGTTAVSASGVITYTQTKLTSGSFWSHFSSLFFPKVSAAGLTDNFTYRVCSQASASLCSSGTVTVNLLGANVTAPDTGYGSSDPNITGPLMIAGILSLAAGLILAKRQGFGDN